MNTLTSSALNYSPEYKNIASACAALLLQLLWGGKNADGAIYSAEINV